MNGISLIISSVKQKSGKKRSRRKKHTNLTRQNENLAIEGEENMPKKIKKIKIRLVDPNIPDSYICEVFDSSLEQDEDEGEDEKKKMQGNSVKNLNLKDKSKPKDYFDVLMSKKSQRSISLNTVVQRKEKKFMKDVESNNLLSNNEIMKDKSKGKLVDMINNMKGSNEYCSSTSDGDGDGFFQVQSKFRLFATNSSTTCSSKTVPNSESEKNEERDYVHKDPDSPPTNGISPVKRNKPNILNYFSKTETPKGSAVGQVKSIKFTDIEALENIKSIDTENISVSDEPKTVTRNEVVKLAPLFQNKTKNVIDPKVQKARLKFLQNGLPAIMKKISKNRKIMEEKYSTSLFPAISHVQQKDDDPMWNSTDFCIPYLKTVEDDHDFSGGNKTFRFEVCQNTSKHLEETRKQSFDINDLKSKYGDLNAESIFNSFKEKRERFIKKMQESSLDVGKKVESDCIKVTDIGEGCNSLWTEIYRPKSSEIIGNKQTIAKLSSWLKSWKEYSYKIMKSNVNAENKVSESIDDSDDDFVSSMDEDLRLRTPKNICLLSGPIGSGKTTLVYALASELDYSILEVNASSKRTGRKLLLDLQEATKSHEVSSGFGLLTENNRINSKIKTVKSRKKKSRKENDKTVTSQINNKISLILIEDADIYFEDHDEGFVTAITTLIQSTKRPFIFLSNDPSYGYLERLKLQKALTLEMRRPDFQSSCAILDIIAVLEGVDVEKETLGNLVRNNKYDLRKCILELQFWIQSGKSLKQHRFFELGKLWWGFNKFLYMKDSIHRLKLNYRKRKRTSDLYDPSSDEEETAKKVKLNLGNVKTAKNQQCERKIDPSIHAYSKILDSVSMTDLFKLEGDPEPIPWREFRPKDGLSLNECMESVDWKAKNLSKLIANEFVTVSSNIFVNSCRDRCSSNYSFCSPPWEETLWRNVQQKAKFDLISLVPSNISCNKRVLHLDYLPTLRNICRSERTRYQGNTKRKNRFCHYFKSLGFNARNDSLDISCGILEN